MIPGTGSHIPSINTGQIPSVGSEIQVCTNADHSINTAIKLEVPFGAVSEINVQETDIYSQETFETLIQAQEQQKLPYFLALTRDSNGSIQAVDGTMFMRNYFKYGHEKSSATRGTIIEAQIYAIDSLKDAIFQNFCALSALKEQGHFAKFINACDPNLAPYFRGQERYYLGTFFEGVHDENEDSNSKDLEKAFFWYNKSAADGFFGGHLALATWYESGNEIVERSPEKAADHLKKSFEMVPPENPFSSQIANEIKKHEKDPAPTKI